jgi:hypothetical protein
MSGHCGRSKLADLQIIGRRTYRRFPPYDLTSGLMLFPRFPPLVATRSGFKVFVSILGADKVSAVLVDRRLL